MRQTLALDGLNRLQEFLLAMAIGDQLSAKHASEISGLDCKRCQALLDALMRAGVMMHFRHDTYVRCRLEPLERPFDPAAEPSVKDGRAPVVLNGRA